MSWRELPHYPYTDSEYEILTEGGSVLPEAFVCLLAQIKIECAESLGEISRQVNTSKEIPFPIDLNDPKIVEAQVKKIFRRIVENSNYDPEAQISSFDYFVGVTSDAVLSGDDEALRRMLQEAIAEISSLYIQGLVSRAFMLGKLISAISILYADDFKCTVESVDEGNFKPISWHKSKKIRILRVINGFLGRNIIPNKKALINELNWDPSVVAKALGPHLQDLLPSAKPHPSEFKIAEGYRIEAVPRKAFPIPLPCGEVETPFSGEWKCVPKEGSVGTTEIAEDWSDYMIRTLEDGLGSSFFALLAKLQLPIPESVTDLDVFEEKLGELGLSVDWQRLIERVNSGFVVRPEVELSALRELVESFRRAQP